MELLKSIGIVVTHNRCNLLKRCLKYLQSQSVKLNEILVIDNGSSDGTREVLKQFNVKVIHQDNLGSAGGWHTGLKYAVENGFEAAWLMDDDGYPDKKAYEILKNNFSKDTACVSSVLINENDNSKFVFPFPILDKQGLPKFGFQKRNIISYKEFQIFCNEEFYPWAHLFNGALVSIDSVKIIGNVNKDYFLYGDEVDYFFRLRKSGKVISNANALHFHPEASKRPFTKTKIFYFIRNSIINYKKYYNHKFLRCTLGILYILFIIYQRNNIKVLLSLLIGKDKKIFYSSLYQGLIGKLGYNN